MADDLFAFSRESVARLWRAVLAVERYLLPNKASAAGDRSRRLPRTYRRFTLTAELLAGDQATVTWADVTTGTVYDRQTNCWGLEGESGEATAVPTGDGIEWQVCQNPGQGTYPGTLDSDVTSSGSVSVTVPIDGNDRTLSATLSANPGTDKQWAEDSPVYVAHFRGAWHVVSIWACAEDVPT